MKWMGLLAIALCASCNAGADVTARVNQCTEKSSPQRVIEACSSLIGGPIQLDTDTVEYVRLSRAKAYDDLGRLDDAIGDVDAVLRLHPNWSIAYGYRGSLLRRRGKVVEALADLDRAVELDPRNALALVDRGATLEHIGKYAEARTSYDQALGVESDNTLALGGRCWTQAVMREELEQAVADCTKAMSISADPNHHSSRGFAYFRMQRYAEAIRDYDAAIAGDPNAPSSYYVRGLAKRALGDAAGGDADIKKGVEIDPRVVERYKGFGVTAD